jgi:hypothetical protein
MVEYIRRRLGPLSQAEWKVVASDCGVSYSGLEKVVYGVTKNPGVKTVEPIYNYLRAKEDAEASRRVRQK